MGAGPCRSGRPPGWISIPILRNLWCGPCDAPWIVLICGKHWPAGEISFDRLEALSRIPEDVGRLEHLDVAGVRREAAKRVRISAEDEYRTAPDQFLILQPSLDESWWKGCGSAWTEPPEPSSTRQSPRRPMICPSSPTGAEATPHGGKQWPWPNSVSETIRHPPNSPYSSTPPKPPHPTEKQEWSSKPDPGSDEKPSKPSSAMRSPKSPPEEKTAHPWSTGGEPGPSHPPYDGPSSTATATPAPATAVPAPTDSKSTTSSPGHKAEPPTPTI